MERDADAARERLYPLGHAPLEDAPDRVLQLTLQHLSARDLCAMRLVSQRMNEQATEGPLWTKLARRVFRADAAGVLEGGGRGLSLSSGAAGSAGSAGGAAIEGFALAFAMSALRR